MACGGGASEMEHHPTQGAEGEGYEGHSGGEAGEEHSHPELPEQVSAYHSLMAPIWHANDEAAEGEGSDRGQLACEQAAAFVEHAQAVQSASTPELAAADESAWQGATSGLVSASEALKADCDAGGADAEQKLTEIHDAFHGLVELLRAE
jgi:hypothetical protein